MEQKSPKPVPAGTTDQSPRWEGPRESRPRGYMPAADDPSSDRDAFGETLDNPARNKNPGAGKAQGDPS